MIRLGSGTSVFNLDTTNDTRIFRGFGIIDPSVVEGIVECDAVDREHYGYDYRSIDLNGPTIMFIQQVASEFLDMFNYNHKKTIWYMDVIRYNLNGETPIDSGLAWHCENDNYSNLITVLMYPRVDGGVRHGGLGYIDSKGVEQKIMIETDTVIVMDGEVVHKPDNPHGIGKRDLIAVSFEKYSY